VLRGVFFRAKKDQAIMKIQTSAGVLAFSPQNKKLGSIGSFSLPAGYSVAGVKVCVDLSAGCAGCYAAKLAKFRPSVGGGYEQNFLVASALLGAGEAGFYELVGALASGVAGSAGYVQGVGSAFRLHVSGDFFSVAYAKAWLAVAEKLPDIAFLAYTRSVSVFAQLEKNRALTLPQNFKLILSQDSDNARSVGNFASRWGLPVATMGDHRQEVAESHLLQCPEQVKKGIDCAKCGACWRGTFGQGRQGVFFKLH